MLDQLVPLISVEPGEQQVPQMQQVPQAPRPALVRCSALARPPPDLIGGGRREARARSTAYFRLFTPTKLREMHEARGIPHEDIPNDSLAVSLLRWQTLRLGLEWPGTPTALWTREGLRRLSPARVNRMAVELGLILGVSHNQTVESLLAWQWTQ